MGKTTKLTTEEFIKRARKVYGDKYDYSATEYINKNTKVKIICKIHGIKIKYYANENEIKNISYIYDNNIFSNKNDILK